jgi:uncharacterized membrane protein
MKKKSLSMVIILSVFIIIGGVAACRHSHHPRGFDAFDLAAATDRIAFRLDLTESQKIDLDQMAREIAEKAKAMHTDRADRHQVLADMIRQDEISRDVVDTMITNKVEKLQEMADFTVDRLIAFHGTLTPDQREKIATHIENRSSTGCRFGWR